MKLRRFLIPSLLVAAWFSSVAQEVKPQNKALYLINFTKYFDWTHENISIGFVGDSPIFDEMRKLLTRDSYIRLLDNLQDDQVSGCDMIFLPKAHNERFAVLQEVIGSRPVILVTDSEELISEGAEISFYVASGNKLRFIVNREELENTGIRMSTKLLSYAKVLSEN